MKQVDCSTLSVMNLDRPESKYGWIEPGDIMEHGGRQSIRRIARFIEKPYHDRAEQLLKKKECLWNTMVIVVRARALMDLI